MAPGLRIASPRWVHAGSAATASPTRKKVLCVFTGPPSEGEMTRWISNWPSPNGWMSHATGGQFDGGCVPSTPTRHLEGSTPLPLPGLANDSLPLLSYRLVANHTAGDLPSATKLSQGLYTRGRRARSLKSAGACRLGVALLRRVPALGATFAPERPVRHPVDIRRIRDRRKSGRVRRSVRPADHATPPSVPPVRVRRSALGQSSSRSCLERRLKRRWRAPRRRSPSES